jgi:hypothetical protein
MAIQAPSPQPNLTPNDATILTALFDPETLPSTTSTTPKTARIDSTLPSLPQIPDNLLATLEAEQKTLIGRLNSTPSASEIKSIEAAITNTIETHPTYPSAYLNRAQITRLLLETTHGTLFTPQTTEPLQSILTDLQTAIALTTPSHPTPSSPISPYQSHILLTAHSHLAYLYLKASETSSLFSSSSSSSSPSASTSTSSALPKQIAGKSQTELEELASKEFGKAAWYGDPVAREMSVRTNPYAKMCGAIVRNAIEEERKGAGWG